MAISEEFMYEYDPDDQYALPEFHRKFKDKLPLLVIVTGGFDGQSCYDDFSNDQVIRLHRTCRQLRVLGRLARDAYCQTDEFLSIPVYGSHVFAVVRRPETVGSPQTMEEILAENTLPVQVRYISSSVRLPFTLQCIRTLNILVMKTYFEDYIQGNCLDEDILNPIPTLVALSPEISVSVITGYKNKSKEAFQAKLKSMDTFVEKNIKFKENEGSPELTMFERDSLTTGTGNAIPPDLLPDYTEGHIYEDAPEPNPDWRPPKPQKPNLQNKPPLPDRPQGSSRPVQKQINSVVQESSTSEETYTYVSDRTLSGFESGYNSASGSGSSFVSEKTVKEIQDLLKQLHLSRFCDVFQTNLVDGNLLEELNEEALRADFGFMYVEAVKLMIYVRTGHIPR